jgi:hypothetical protein
MLIDLKTIKYLKYPIFLTSVIACISLVSCSKLNKGAYPKLNESKVILQGKHGEWDEHNVHTLSVVESNKGGYRYWGYYGLNHYGKPSDMRKCGLIWSNDLINWNRYSGNPIIDSNCRWPTVVLEDGVFYMFYAEYKSNMDSRIVRVTSKDGIHFSEKEVIVPFEIGIQNQNPFIFYDSKSKNYCLFYYHGKERGQGELKWDIYLKKSADINTLKIAPPQEILSAPYTIAAPSIAYYNNRYYLLIEAFNPKKWGSKWVTRAFESSNIDGNFVEVNNSPILLNDDACAFQYIFEGGLFIFYSHQYDIGKSHWELRMVEGEK